VLIENTSVKHLTDIILEKIHSLGINPKYILWYLRQGYDGEATEGMTERKLVQAIYYSKRIYSRTSCVCSSN